MKLLGLQPWQSLAVLSILAVATVYQRIWQGGGGSSGGGSAFLPGAAARDVPAACGRPQQMQAMLKQLRSMRASVFDFWLKHGMDEEYGGFHAVRCMRLCIVC
jgi:hypothetical protein